MARHSDPSGAVVDFIDPHNESDHARCGAFMAGPWVIVAAGGARDRVAREPIAGRGRGAPARVPRAPHGTSEFAARASIRGGAAPRGEAGGGWLASAYNTSPDAFASARERSAAELVSRGKSGDRFPNALVTMWTRITGSRVERDRVLSEVLARLLKRDADQVCVGERRAAQPLRRGWMPACLPLAVG